CQHRYRRATIVRGNRPIRCSQPLRLFVALLSIWHTLVESPFAMSHSRRKHKRMSKSRLLIWSAIVFLGMGVMLAHAEEKKRDAHGRMMARLMQQLKTVLNANSAIGAALDFEGTKVMPIVQMGFDLSVIPPNAQKAHDDEDDDDDDGEE